MKIRFLSCFLALAVFLTCFAACGGDGDKEKVTSSNSSSDSSSEDTTSDSFEILTGTDSSTQQVSNQTTNLSSSNNGSSSASSSQAEKVSSDDGSPNAAKYAHSKKLNLLNSNNEFEYSIIYPEEMTTEELSLARRVYRAANKISENIPEYKSDSNVAASSSSKEVLIGLTNRAESETMRNKLKDNRANNFYDYIIAVSGNKIIIDADSTEILEEAITFFINTFLDEDAEHTIPEDYLFIRADETTTAMKIAGKDVSNYVIVCEETPSYMVYKSLEELQTAIKEKTDYVVPIVKTNDSSKYQDKIIATVGGNNTNTYSVSFDGTNVVMQGGHNYSLSAAIHALAANISAVSAGSAFNIPKNYSYKGTYSSASPTTEGYHLVYSDEFNGTTLDTDVWQVQDFLYGANTFAEGIKDGGGSANNVKVSDGYLQLSATLEQRSDGLYSMGGGVISNLSFQYGLLEIRAKINPGPGNWPAFWCNSTLTLEKNYGPEIDIFEFFNTDMAPTSNLHSWWTSGRNIAGHYATDSDIASGHTQHLSDEDGNKYYLPSGESYAETFHTFSLEWTPKAIKFSVDGYNYCTQSLTSFLTHPEYGYSINEFMFFLNKSVDIRFGTSIGKDYITHVPIDELNEGTFYIDYVHLYQMDGVGSLGETF